MRRSKGRGIRRVFLSALQSDSKLPQEPQLQRGRRRRPIQFHRGTSGLRAEFMGYGSTNFTIPAGTYNIPKLSPNPIVVNAPITTQGNMFTYLFGPVVRFPISRVAPLVNCSLGAQTRTATRTRSKGFATTSHAFHPLQPQRHPTPFHHGAWWRTRYQGLHQLFHPTHRDRLHPDPVYQPANFYE